MIKLEPITDHVSADVTIQKRYRASVIGAISLDKYSIAVDSGNSIEMGKEFRKEIEAHFKIPVNYLFLTHVHPDHRNGMEAFTEDTLIVSENCKKNMPTSVRMSKFNWKAFEDKLILEENDLKVEFIKVAGHSIGSSAAYLPSEKVLFGGDLFFVGSGNFGIPFMSLYQNKPRKTGNPEEYLAAFDTFLNMNLEVLIPGHGDIVYNPKDYLESIKQFFTELKEFIIDEIKDKKSLEEIGMPDFEFIKEVYRRAHADSNQRKAIKFTDHCFNLLKKSFYYFYSDESN